MGKTSLAHTREIRGKLAQSHKSVQKSKYGTHKAQKRQFTRWVPGEKGRKRTSLMGKVPIFQKGEEKNRARENRRAGGRNVDTC